MPPEAIEILSSIRLAGYPHTLPKKTENRDIQLPQLGISFTAPEGFTDHDARTSDGFLFGSMKRMNGLTLSIQTPDNPQTEAQVLQKIKYGRNGFVWEDVVQIGGHTYFVYRNPLFSDWCFWLRSAGQSVAYLYFTPLEPTDSIPMEATEILSSVRFLK